MKEQFHIKVYHGLANSGLLSALPGKSVKTLLALAMFMNEEGKCFPSRTKLAKILGVSEKQVSFNIKALEDFRFNGKPIVEVDRSNWNNFYRVLPASQIAIFDGEVEFLEPNFITKTSPSRLRKGNQLSNQKVTLTRTNNENQEQENNISSKSVTQDVETKDEPFKNAGEIVKYYCKKYREKYNVNYNASFKKEVPIVKNTLVKNYTMEQIKRIIDLSFEHYDEWGDLKRFPRLTLGALTTWLPNKVMELLEKQIQNDAELERAMNVPEHGGRDINDLFRVLGGGE